MILMLTFSLLFFLLLSSSPLKLSLTLASISTLMGLFLYQLTNSVFIPCALIISFSSGMMILFSYCSVMSNHESKNSSSSPKLFLILPSLLMMLNQSAPITMENSMQKMILECTQTTLLILLMTLVVITMFCMNITFFNPTKKFMQSY